MTNKITYSLLVLAVGGLIYVGSAAAQTATPAPPSATPTTPTSAGPGSANGGLDVGPGKQEPHHPWANHVNHREQREQNRVANGVKDGDLTATQAAADERREAQIQNQERRDLAANHGHLTKAERNKLNREETALGRRTARQEHHNKK